ncbi:hypothetical protein RJT34_29750 [Clitoria ternatea]|uniref:Uncharacterized protein n=1 Tax=Clitoria ternatea TaxID=43366 RepID=A0AAN9EYS4_CLITE
MRCHVCYKEEQETQSHADQPNPRHMSVPIPRHLQTTQPLSIGKYMGETDPCKHLDVYVYEAMFLGDKADVMFKNQLSIKALKLTVMACKVSVLTFSFSCMKKAKLLQNVKFLTLRARRERGCFVYNDDGVVSEVMVKGRDSGEKSAFGCTH